MFRLSKSKMMSGLQCRKRLHLEIHRPELMEFSAASEMAFDIGHEVGNAARQQFPNGILVDPAQAQRLSIEATQKLLATHEDITLFEPTFVHGGILIKADVLVRQDQTLQLVEVKASSSLKSHYLQDVAIQTWVIQGTGHPLQLRELWHVNTSFVYPGEGDYRGLFTPVDVSDEVREFVEQVPSWMADFQKVLAGVEPDIPVGPHCTDPYDCPFLGHCSPPVEGIPVRILPNAGKLVRSLEAEGLQDLREVPLDRLRSDIHQRIWRVSRSGTAELDPALSDTLNAHPYPRYFLDFETIQFAVPIWAGTRPYEQLPFQWSCHVKSASDAIEHRENLDTAGNAPMRCFAESLIAAVDKAGPIFVYSSFEKTVIRNLIKRFQDLTDDLEAIIERLVDLLPLTRAHYYHPDMQGSWSIKAVLPTVAPQLGYDNLGEVQDGGGAQMAYREIIAPETAADRRAGLVTDLRAYCQRDTEAMVELVRYFECGMVR